MASSKKFFAFISYSSKDADWAKWVHHELEHYSLPASVIEEEKLKPLPKDLRPVFRDDDELSAGKLMPQIEKALSNSRSLIVICSPHAKASHWVNLEIEYFIRKCNPRMIFPFIIEGDSPESCFPKALDRSIAGANVNKSGKDAALVKVVAGILGVEFPSLWNRYEKEKVAKEAEERMKRDKLLTAQSRFVSQTAEELVENGDSFTAIRLALEVLPDSSSIPDRPYSPEAERVLRKAVNNNSGILSGHSACVNAALFSQDGTSVISVSDDSTVKVWDASSGFCKKTLRHHVAEITYICYCKTRGIFATASKDSNVVIWDERTLSPLRTISHDASVYHIAFSNDGSNILTLTGDSIIRIWRNGEKGTQLFRELEESDTRGALYAFFCQDDNHILIAFSSEVKVFKIKGKAHYSCIKSFHFDASQAPVWCVNHNDVRDIIIIVNGKEVILLDAKNNYNPICRPIEHNRRARWACMNPSSNQIAVTSDSDVVLWDFDKNSGIVSYKKKLTGHTHTVLYVSFNHDGSQLLSTSSDETIRLWNNIEKRSIIASRIPFTGLVSIPDSDKVVGKNGTTNALISLKTGKTLREAKSFWSFSGQTKTRSLFVGSSGKTVYDSIGLGIIQLGTSDLCPKHRPLKLNSSEYSYTVCSHAVSPHGKYALTSFKEGIMYLWNVVSGMIIKEFQSGNKRSIKGAFSPDGKTALTIAWDRNIELWDCHSGRFIREFELPHNYMGTSVSFSQDGKQVISSSSSCKVYLWDTQTGMLIKNGIYYYEFSSPVHYVEFSRDSRYFIATTYDGDVLVFETVSGLLIDAYTQSDIGVQGRIFNAIFSGDSSRILNVTNESTTIIPFPQLSELIKQQKERFQGQELSISEKRRFFLE